jgi:hypothetical protein
MKTTTLYFENAAAKTRYRVLDKYVNGDGVTVLKLQGQHATFEEVYDKELFKKLGYTLVKVEEGDDDE